MLLHFDKSLDHEILCCCFNEGRKPTVSFYVLVTCPNILSAASVRADELDVDGTVEDDLGKSREGSRTDDEVVQRSVFKTFLQILLEVHTPNKLSRRA